MRRNDDPRRNHGFGLGPETGFPAILVPAGSALLETADGDSVIAIVASESVTPAKAGAHSHEIAVQVAPIRVRLFD